MAKKRTRPYFEPWRASPSRAWHLAFGDDPPPADDADALDRWRSARARAEENAEWVIWGSKMFEPSVTYAPVTGEPVVSDDRHLVTRLGPVHTDNPNPPTHGELALRVVECVNALAGVADPGAMVGATRDLLSDLTTGRITADDARVVALLSRWLPVAKARNEDEE